MTPMLMPSLQYWIGAIMQERAYQTRREILRAAAQAFDAHGYFGTRLQDIVAQRHVSKGALYFHFQSKEGLAQAVVQEQYDMWVALTSDLRAQYPRAVRGLLELTWLVARMMSDEAIARAGIRLLLERTVASPEVPHPFQAWTSLIEELLTEARAQRELLSSVDVGEAARFVVIALAGLHQVRETDQDADLRLYVTTIWRYALPGLVTPACLADLRAALPDLADQP